jgi:hypothetical protein
MPQQSGKSTVPDVAGVHRLIELLLNEPGFKSFTVTTGFFDTEREPLLYTALGVVYFVHKDVVGVVERCVAPSFWIS